MRQLVKVSYPNHLSDVVAIDQPTRMPLFFRHLSYLALPTQRQSALPVVRRTAKLLSRHGCGGLWRLL